MEKFSIWYKYDSIDVNLDYLGNRSQITRIVRYIKNSPDRDAVLQILDDDRYHNDAKIRLI